MKNSLSDFSLRVLSIEIALIFLLLISMPIQVSAKEYAPATGEELVEAVNEINMNGDPAVLVLEGVYQFNTLGPGDAFPIPEITALKVAIIASPSAKIVWVGPSPSEISSEAILRRESSEIDLGEAVMMFLTGEGIPSEFSKAIVHSVDSIQTSFDGVTFIEGFESVFSVSNTNLVVSGLVADCEDQCISTENSQLVVTQSSFDCKDECIFASSNMQADASEAWHELRQEIAAAELEGFTKTAVLRQFDEAVALNDDGQVVVEGTRASSSDAGLVVTGFEEQRIVVRDSFLQTRSSGSKAVSLDSSVSDNLILNSVISAPISRTDALAFTYGSLRIENSFIDAGEQGMSVTDGSITLKHVSVAMDMEDLQQVCDTTFGSDEFVSEGGNIVPDDSCALDGPLDTEMTEPGLYMAGEEDNVPTLAPGSPEVERGALAATSAGLPCSQLDMTGLPRPQDADKDGNARCDTGPVEKQVGGNIGAPQSGAYYAPERDGEGIFVEVISDKLALVYLFSYRPDGSPFWALGLGQIDRNGIVIPKDGFRTTRGATFGEEFDPADIVYTPFANFAASLPGCTGGSNAGMLSIEQNDELGFAPLLGRTTALTAVMDCDLNLKGRGLSGSFYDPSHDGEGIIVQVISETSAVIIWFTYDSEGNQYWILGAGNIEGNTITVNSAFSQFGPTYGPSYDPDAIQTVDWGSFTATFSDDCKHADFSYDSLLEAFGSGTQDMNRLTNLQGVSCSP